jgi:hypothetical protein
MALLHALLKYTLVAASLVCGAYFLLQGLGVAIPAIKYKGLETGNLPAGLVLLAVAVLLAKYWKVETTKKITTEGLKKIIKRLIHSFTNELRALNRDLTATVFTRLRRPDRNTFSYGLLSSPSQPLVLPDQFGRALRRSLGGRISAGLMSYTLPWLMHFGLPALSLL